MLKELNGKDNSIPFREIVEFSKQNTIINAEININNNLKWKNRLQWSRVEVENSESRGFLISTGLNYRNEKVGLRCGFHLFDADNIENRQYVYLNSLPYAYQYGGFQNKGSNVNAAANLYINSNTLLSVSFTQTVYDNVNESGVGVDKITGNRRTDVGAQLILNF